MITVKIKRNSANAVTVVDVSGHAFFASPGEDIVCAGVSALVQAAIMGLERHLEREIKLKQEKKQTKSKLRLELIEQPDDLTQAILETMLLGVGEIVKLYPEHVRIEDFRG